MAFQRLPLNRLDGGLHTASPPQQIQDNEMVIAKNLEYDDSDDLCSRLGVADVIAEANVATSIASIMASADINLPRWGVYDATNLLFFVSNYTGDSVTLIDVSDVNAPVPIGSITGAGFDTCSGVVVDETAQLLFVANTVTDNIKCVDYSDPYLPTVVDTFTSTDDANLNGPYGLAIDTTNKYVWAACANGNAIVGLNYSTPSALASVGSLSDATNLAGAVGICLNVDFTEAYVTAQTNSRLTVVNLSTPATPAVTGSVSDATNINNPAKIVYSPAQEHVFFTAYGSTGTRVTSVDVSVPATPTVSDTIVFGNANPDNQFVHGGLTYDGGLLFVSCGRQDYVVILNVSEADNMQTLSLIQNTGVFLNPTELHYDVDSNNMFLTDADSDKFVVLQLRSSAAINEVGSVTTRASEDWEAGVVDPDDDLTSYWWDIGTAPDRFIQFTGALTTGPGAGTALASASVATGGVNKHCLALFEMNSKKYIALVGTVAVIATLGIFCITDNTWVVEDYNLQTSGGDVGGVLFWEDHLFICKDSDSVNAEYLQVYDVTTPEAPKKIGSLAPDGVIDNFDTIRGHIEIDTDNDLLFIMQDNSLGNEDMLHVIDISDKTKPVLKSTTKLGDGVSPDCSDLKIHPDYTKRYLYAVMSAELWVYQYSADGTTITYVNDSEMPGSNDWIYMGENGNFLLGAPTINESELHVYSLQDPTRPFHVAQYASSATKAPIFPTKGHKHTWNDHVTDGSVIHASYLETVTLGGTRRQMGLLDLRRLQGAIFLGEAVNLPFDTPEAIVNHGVHSYIAASVSDAVTKLNVNDIGSPYYVGSLTDATNLNGVNSLAYETGDILVAGMPGRITTLDVSADDPVVLGTVTDASLNNLNSICHIEGSAYVYAITDGDYLVVIDISTPASPSVVGSLSDATNLAAAKGCAVNDEETRVYTINDDDVVSINVSIKSTPVFASATTFASDLSDGRDLVYEDDTLYVASYGNDTVAIFDVTVTDSPSLTGKVTDATNLNGVIRIAKAAGQPRLYVTAYLADAVSILDIENEVAPTVLQTYTDADNLADALPVAGRGAVIYTASSTADRYVIVQFQGLPFSVEVTSIFQYSDPDDDDDPSTIDPQKKIIVTSGTGIYEFDWDTGGIDDRTGSVEITDITSPWQWATLDDLALGANGEVLVYWSGGSYFSEVTNVPDSLTRPKHIAVWASRLFVAQGTVVYFSKLGDPTDFTHQLAGNLEVPDGKEITGLYAHKGHLFIFSRESIHRIQPGVPDTDETAWSVELVSNNLGCISAWSIQTVLDDVLFLSGSGVASLAAAEIAGDFQTAQASVKIKELEDISLAEEKYPSVVDDINSQYWLTVPIEGTDTTYVLDFKRGKDYRWTTWEGLVVGGYYAQVLDSSGEKQILIAGDRTLYRKKRDDDADPYSDAGGAYAKHFRGKEFDHDVPYQRKEIDRYGVSIEKKTAAVEVVTKLYYDGNVTTAAMTNTWDLDSLDTGRDLVMHRKVWGTKGRRYRTAQLDLTNSAIEGFCINSFLLDVELLTHRRTSEV